LIERGGGGGITSASAAAWCRPTALTSGRPRAGSNGRSSSGPTLFAFAGLWETWRGPDGAAVETCTILTTTANDRVRHSHDRMPVIVTPPHFATWLDAAHPHAEVERLFAPAPAASLTATPGFGRVNDVRHEGAQCRRCRGACGRLAGTARIVTVK